MTSGWNCTPAIRRSTSSKAATGAPGVLASTSKPGGGTSTLSPCDIQTFCVSGRPFSRVPGAQTVNVVPPYSLPSVRATEPPKALSHGLESVADPEYRNVQIEDSAVERGSMWLVHTGRPTTKDDRARVLRSNVLHRDGVGDDLGIDIGPREPCAQSAARTGRRNPQRERDGLRGLPCDATAPLRGVYCGELNAPRARSAPRSPP